MASHIYFVGTQDEVAHHAAPLSGIVDYQIVEPEKIDQVAVPGDLAIFYTEHFDRFRSAINRLRAMSVGTLYMIDGILEWRNAWVNRDNEPACPFTMRPVLSDKVACIGASQYRILQSWGNAGKVEIVGIPRLEQLKTLKKRQRADGEAFRLMVATAKCPSYTEFDHENLRRCLIDIRDYANRSTDIEVVWRLTAEWDQKLGIENSLKNVDGGELGQQLPTIDAVVTTPSTTALESMMLDLPTAIVDYNNCPSYFQTAWRISAANQIGHQINQMRSPPEEKLLFQRQSLGDSLYLESSAIERMADLVSKMQEHLLAKQNTQFPEYLIDAPSDSIVKFKPAELFENFNEFQIDDVGKLQTELAHSRREIDHLNAELHHLKEELGEAHRIFDEINGHPIAGPIVKVRQKMLDIMQKIRRSSPRPKTN